MLGIEINNETLKAFLNPVNSIDPYQVNIKKDQIEYEIEENHIRHKTILLNTGCENYNIDHSVCLELPLKRIKDVLRRIVTKKDNISITQETRDMQNMLVFNCNTINYKIKYTELQETRDSEQIKPSPIVSEDENTTPNDQVLKKSEYVLSQGKYKCVKCKTFKFLVNDSEGFRYCPECHETINPDKKYKMR